MLGRNHLIVNTSSVIIGYSALQWYNNFTPQNFTIPFTNTIIENNIGDKIITFFSQPEFTYLWLLCVVLFYLGTLFPDIDNRNSLLGRYLHLNVEHRTWTHTAWLLIVFAIISYFWLPFLWFTIGFYLHIFFDSLSKGGVCWFYPLSQYRGYANGAKVKINHKCKLYSVGGMSEYIIVALCVIMAIGCVYWCVNNGFMF